MDKTAPAGALLRTGAYGWTRTVAASCGGLCVLLMVAFVAASFAAHDAVDIPGNVVVFISATAVGCILTYRLPGLPIGWLLLAAVAFALLQDTAKAYLVADYKFHHGSLVATPAAIVVSASITLLPTILLAAAVLLLPDGKSPSARWRWVTRAYVAVSVVVVVSQVIGAVGILDQHIHVGKTGLPTNTPQGVYGDIADLFVLAFFLIVVWIAWIVSQVKSFRRSRGTRRQQMKWLLAGGVVSAVSVVVGTVLQPDTGDVATAFYQLSRAGIAAFPIAIAFAVFRYQLYELGRLVSRTVSYVLVTAVVVGVYVAVVTLTTKALGFSSPGAVAASTLAAVVVFNPARKRLQRGVDRRFNRAAYDAEQMVTAFAGRLREAVDPGSVSEDLVHVVRATFEPQVVGVWVRPTADVGPGT